MNLYYSSPFTAREVARALAIYDDAEQTGESIARDMLDGVVPFEPDELERLAAFKGVTVEYLTEHDPAFRRYADPAVEARKAIAAKLIGAGTAAEFAAELCGLPVDVARRLK